MTNKDAKKRLAIVGAGPMGLEAALGAIERGFDVTVFEAGRIAQSLREWGPTHWFTPLEMNLSARARALLGSRAPDPSAILTGPQSAEQVFEPLANTEPLASRIRTGTQVLNISRRRLARHDYAGHTLRGERPFRLLLKTPEGEEEFEADIVLDASGVYTQPLSTGLGAPALGERDAESLILRRIGDLHQHRMALANQSIAIVGDGHSAANAIVAIQRWIDEGKGPARVHWLVRSRRKYPCVQVPDDPLPERLRITESANQLASSPPPWLEIFRAQTVQKLTRKDDALTVETSRGQRFIAHRLISLTGFRPDLKMLRGLALNIAPPTEGAGPLWSAVSSITDCLSIPTVRPQDLTSGEPGFYLIGHKSYGRSNTFLLNTGRIQLESILDLETP